MFQAEQQLEENTQSFCRCSIVRDSILNLSLITFLSEAVVILKAQLFAEHVTRHVTVEGGLLLVENETFTSLQYIETDLTDRSLIIQPDLTVCFFSQPIIVPNVLSNS
jgi:hypothetical protein